MEVAERFFGFIVMYRRTWGSETKRFILPFMHMKNVSEPHG